MLHAVVMAGGSGTRFWPASRKQVPKQLLKLVGDQTMLQSTLGRLGELVPPERQLVVTNQSLVDAVSQQLPKLPIANIIGEPAKRDTAPCIGLAAALVQQSDPDATMVVMPSDHVIADPRAFQAAIESGRRLVDDDPERIVTFGIKPTYAAESFGYIERGDEIRIEGASAYQVARFREKPDRPTAEAFLQDGTFYWNSGIFLWKAATILAALQQRQPQMYQHLKKIADSVGTEAFPQTLQDEFTAIRGTSIDYAVMENYDNVVVIEAPFPWDDVGSWQALSRLHDPDSAGNTVVGSHIGIETTDSIIHTQRGHTIVTIDCHDLIVVQTADATLVAPRHAEERVREAVKALEQQGRDDLL